MRNPDVIVIGTDVIGVSVAWHLAPGRARRLHIIAVQRHPAHPLLGDRERRVGALIGFEPEALFADATLVAASSARAA